MRRRFIAGDNLVLTLNEDWSGEADVYVAVFSAFVSRNGDGFYSNTRHYFFSRSFAPQRNEIK
jgi:hypothetical protein